MLVDTIRQQVKEAMRSGDKVRRDVLRVALGEIESHATRSGRDLTDDEAAVLVRKLVKSNRESLEATSDEARRGVLEQEIAILEALLPRTLDVDEIVGALGAVRSEILAAPSDGAATGIAMKHLKAGDASVEGRDVAAAIARIRA